MCRKLQPERHSHPEDRGLGTYPLMHEYPQRPAVPGPGTHAGAAPLIQAELRIGGANPMPSHASPLPVPCQPHGSRMAFYELESGREPGRFCPSTRIPHGARGTTPSETCRNAPTGAKFSCFQPGTRSTGKLPDFRGVLLPCSGIAHTLAGAEEAQCSRHGAVKGETTGTVW